MTRKHLHLPLSSFLFHASNSSLRSSFFFQPTEQFRPPSLFFLHHGFLFVLSSFIYSVFSSFFFFMLFFLLSSFPCSICIDFTIADFLISRYPAIAVLGVGHYVPLSGFDNYGLAYAKNLETIYIVQHSQVGTYRSYSPSLLQIQLIREPPKDLVETSTSEYPTI